MSTELVPIDAIERMALIVAKSGLFGMKNVEQAAALMMIAHAEGLHPATAALDYDIINNRPAKKPQAMMRDFQKAGGKVQWHEHTDQIVSATFSHPAGGSVTIEWDMKRAVQAGLAGKDNWKKWPRQMLRARVVSEGIRATFPGATGGMYVPEEVADMEPAARVEKDITPDAPPSARPTVAGKLKAAAAQVDTATGEVLERGTFALADYIRQSRTNEELKGFRADVAATDEKSDEGKAVRKAYNEMLEKLPAKPKPAAPPPPPEDAMQGIMDMPSDSL